jgi:CRP-like cAMP-binding protein
MNATMTLIEKTVFLKSVDVFAEVPSEALARLASRAAEVRCDRGEILFRDGDEDRGLYMVVEGHIELRKAGLVVRRLRDGMTHGELFFDEEGPHRTTAIAREDTLLLNLPRTELVDALLEYPEVGLAMVKDLARRLHTVTQRLIEVEAELLRRGSASPVRPGEAIEPAVTAPQPTPAASEVPKQRGWWRRRSSRAARRAVG